MYELNQVGKNTYYINCPAKIGLYKLNDTDAVLIDAGNDRDAGRKVKKILDQQGWKLKAILNTHSNADHIGGNKYLQNHYHCKIFTKGIEAAFTQYPLLEPSFLYGGYPSKDLRHKFLVAAESEVSSLKDPDFPAELEVIDLPGHFFDMIGIRTPDNVIFLADCISSAFTLDKYQIGFIYDVEAYLKTLDRIETLEADVYVPAHTEALYAQQELKDLAELNRNKVYEIEKQILELLEQPKTFETILKELFDLYSLQMNFEQYVLVGSTVRSYLSWMRDYGKVEPLFEANELKWKRL